MMNRVLLLTLLLTLASAAGAEDYYCVSTTGGKSSGVSTADIDGFAWGDSDCYADPMVAIGEMSAGDQLWINDGAYTETGTAYWITVGTALSGTAEDPTIVRARNPGEVTLTSTTGGGVAVTAASYVTVIGIHVASVNSNYTTFLAGGPSFDLDDASDHILFKRCSWQMDTGSTIDGSHHITWEDCYVFGGPHRYAFQVGTSGETDPTANVIFRRCLIRWDYSDVSEPTGGFANYYSENVAYQNCIVVDATGYEGQENGCFDGPKAFFNPNGGSGSYEGCMAIALSGMCGIWFETHANITVNNCVVWNLKTIAEDVTKGYDPMTFVSSADDGTLLVTNCTFGINDCAGCADPSCGGVAMSPVSFDSDNPAQSIYNCIIYGMDLYTGYYAMDNDPDYYDYNLYYGNTAGRNKLALGTNDITDVDPLTSGLDSPLYVSPCSFLQTAGENGGQIGAQIRTKIGVDGTFYGDTGWDLDTGKPLWPFPYEDQIRERCAAFYMAADAAYTGSPEMDGARGFCGPGETLTSWLLKGGE